MQTKISGLSPPAGYLYERALGLKLRWRDDVVARGCWRELAAAAGDTLACRQSRLWRRVADLRTGPWAHAGQAALLWWRPWPERPDVTVAVISERGRHSVGEFKLHSFRNIGVVK